MEDVYTILVWMLAAEAGRVSSDLGVSQTCITLSQHHPSLMKLVKHVTICLALLGGTWHGGILSWSVKLVSFSV